MGIGAVSATLGPDRYEGDGGGSSGPVDLGAERRGVGLGRDDGVLRVGLSTGSTNSWLLPAGPTGSKRLTVTSKRFRSAGVATFCAEAVRGAATSKAARRRKVS